MFFRYISRWYSKYDLLFFLSPHEWSKHEEGKKTLPSIFSIFIEFRDISTIKGSHNFQLSDSRTILVRNFHNFLPPSPLRSPRVFEAGAGCRTARIAKHKQPRSSNGVWSPLRALQYAGPVDKAKLLLSLLPSPRPSSSSFITAFSFIRGGWKWCIIRNMKFFRDVVIQRKKKFIRRLR